MWGPKYFNKDIPEEFDETKHFKESRYSTYQHLNNSDCPAYNDISKQFHKKPFIREGTVFYPCNVGGCAKA